MPFKSYLGIVAPVTVIQEMGILSSAFAQIAKSVGEAMQTAARK
jgi:hypothetical protein